MSQKRTSKRRGGLSLSLERLEDRFALAGDVNVVLAGNTLKITGDANANDIKITQVNATSTIHIEGVGTNIHLKGGQGAAFQDVVIPNFSKLALTINMLAGDDSVQIGKFAQDAVTIKSLAVNAGAGVDSVNIFNTEITGKGTASITLGKNSEVEHDVMDVEQSHFFGGVNVRSGDGQDDVFFTQTEVDKKLDIGTGKGDDNVVVQSAAVNKINVNLGDGTNDLKILNLLGGFAWSVTGGAGVDTVEANTIQSEKVSVSLGKGADILTAKKITIAKSLKADGGADTDTLNFEQSTSVVPQTTVPKHFENVNLS